MRPGPTATTSPSCGFSLAVSGMMMPPRTVSFSSMRRTRMRSARGWIFMSSSSWIRVGPTGATRKWLRSAGPVCDCARHHSALVVPSTPMVPGGHAGHASHGCRAAPIGLDLRTVPGITSRVLPKWHRLPGGRLRGPPSWQERTALSSGAGRGRGRRRAGPRGMRSESPWGRRGADPWREGDYCAPATSSKRAWRGMPSRKPVLTCPFTVMTSWGFGIWVRVKVTIVSRPCTR